MGSPNGILISAWDFSNIAEDEFNDWYDTEHIPERSRCPGFLRIKRWMSVLDPKTSVTTYELSSVAAFDSAEYRAVGYENNGPWTRRMQRKGRHAFRFEGSQAPPPGNTLPPDEAGGLLVMTFNVAPQAVEDYCAWMDQEHLPNLAKVPGVLCARRYVATRSTHRYLAIYHLTSPEVCDSPPWYAARETPWTHRIRESTSDRLRLVCRPYVRAA